MEREKEQEREEIIVQLLGAVWVSHVRDLRADS